MHAARTPLVQTKPYTLAWMGHMSPGFSTFFSVPQLQKQGVTRIRKKRYISASATRYKASLSQLTRLDIPNSDTSAEAGVNNGQQRRKGGDTGERYVTAYAVLSGNLSPHSS